MHTGILCGPRIYSYSGWIFEISRIGGPWPHKKDGELRKRAGNVFYKMIEKFNKLDKKEQEKYRVGGGCLRF